jgi:hypothetical protein
MRAQNREGEVHAQFYKGWTTEKKGTLASAQRHARRDAPRYVKNNRDDGGESERLPEEWRKDQVRGGEGGG